MRKKSGFKQIGMALLAALYLTGCAGKPEATQTPEPAETTAEETSQTAETTAAEESAAAETDRYE